MASNYPTDTLKKAFSTRDSSIIVLSVNNGVFATVFNTSGSFIKRMQLPAKHGRADGIDISALPTASQTYLDAAGVFVKAMTVR